MKDTFTALWRAFGKYRWHIVGLLVFSVISPLLEGIGINALIPFFSFIVGDAGGGTDVISQTIEKLFAYWRIDFNLKYLLMFICLLFVLKAVILMLCTYLKVKITTDYENQTRNQLFNKTFIKRTYSDKLIIEAISILKEAPSTLIILPARDWDWGLNEATE